MLSDHSLHALLSIEDGRPVGQFGGRGSGDGQFQQPTGIARWGVHLAVADRLNDRIVFVSNPPGERWSSLGERGAGVFQFDRPSWIVTDPAGHIWVADTNNGRLVRFDDPDGTNWTEFGRRATPTDLRTPGTLAEPHSLCVFDLDTVLVPDRVAGVVARLTPSTNAWMVHELPAGQRPVAVSRLGDSALVACFNSPTMLVLDRDLQPLSTIDDPLLAGVSSMVSVGSAVLALNALQRTILLIEPASVDRLIDLSLLGLHRSIALEVLE